MSDQRTPKAPGIAGRLALGLLAVLLGLACSASGSPAAAPRPSPGSASTTVAAPSPSATPLLDRCVGPSDQATVLSFPLSDGDSLQGALLGTGTAGVVLAPETDTNVCNWLGLAISLREQGFTALAYDSHAKDQPEEVSGAAAELQRRGVSRIVLVGASPGRSPFVDETRSLYSASSSPDKHLQVFPGSAHGTRLVNGSPQARDTLLAFIRDHLK